MSPPGATRLPPLALAAVLALVIGPHWLLTRDLFDGASIASAWLLQDDRPLVFWLELANWPLAIGFHKLCFGLAQMLGLHYLLFVKLAITGLLLGLYREFRLLGAGLFGLDPVQARWLALLCTASPALYTLASSQIVPILLCVWLVFMGHRFFRASGGRRLAGLLMLAVSFQLNSNLVFAMALEALYLWRFPQDRTARLRWAVLLGVVGVAVYGFMRLASPPQQIFTEYNRLLHPWDMQELKRILRAVAMFLTWGAIPLAAAAAVFVALRPSARGLAAAWPAHAFGLAAGAFLAGSAMFPYVMVGKGSPLFTWIGVGSSLTEQVLAAVHAGPLAPTWANSSGRHAFLFAPGVAIFTWFLCGWLASARSGVGAKAPAWLYPLVLVPFLAGLLPAYWNKLDNQADEVSLVRGLREVAPAAGGIVELRYRPARDWLVPTTSASVMLGQAWNRWDYWAMFHSLDAYRDDMQWQYHAYLRNTGGLRSALIQGYLGMRAFPGEDCISRYEAVLPERGAASVMLAGLWAGGVPAAKISALGMDCEKGRVLPNPTPQKRLIP